MKRVLIYRTELLAASETFIAAQAGALKRYEPWFVGLKREKDGLDLDPARVITLTREEGLRDKLFRRLYLRSGIAPSFHQDICNLRPSLIHAHFAPDGAAALFLLRHLNLPLLVTLHGYDVTANDATLRQTTHGAAFLQRKGALLHGATLFLCASEHIRKQALARGYPEAKLLVLPIGVELPPHDPAEKREQIVLFVGRMVEKKGCIHLLRAWERVEAALPCAKLVLLGDGPLRPSLEQYARLRLKNVMFLGMSKHDDVRCWMRRVQVLAAPSIIASNGDTEGLPTVLCEAQALGLPIVAFHGPGVEEAVVADETALLVPQGDELALAQAIIGALSNQELRAALAEAGRKRAARLFDLQKQTALLEEKYEEIVSRCSWSRT